MAVNKVWCPGANGRFTGQHLLSKGGEFCDGVVEIRRLSIAGTMNLREFTHQHHQRRQLRGKRLGRRHPNFSACLGEYHQVTGPYDSRVVDVTERETRHDIGVGSMLQRRQGVGGLTTLGDTHHQGTRQGHGLAVTKLGGHFHLAGQPRYCFQPMAHDQACVVTGATGKNLHGAYGGQPLLGVWTKTVSALPIHSQRILQTHRLLVNFLEHVVFITSQ